MTNYFQIGPVVFDKNIFFKVFFPFGWHGMVIFLLVAMEWKSFNNLKWDHPRIIPVKFGEIPPSGLVVV